MNGFTLIELLVTMAILAILSAIAVPQYKDYRARAFDINAQLEVRNVAMAEEVYFLDEESYFDCQGQDCLQLPGITKISEGVQIVVESNGEQFTVAGSHVKGTGKVFTWDSSQGGFG